MFLQKLVKVMPADGSNSFDSIKLLKESSALAVSDEFYFPKTRYAGSKRRLSAWLRKNFESLEFDTALDAFGGTGTVSMMLLQMDKSVTFHDCFEFNYVSAKALLNNERVEITRDAFISSLNSVKPRKGFIAKTFNGMFYPEDENKWLDGLQELIRTRCSRPEVDVLRYCAYQACLQKRPYNMFHRPNLHLRTSSNVVRSFGNLTTWQRSFSELMLRSYDELCAARTRMPRPAKIMRPTALMKLPKGFDLVYLDPPYLKPSKNESYLHRYHFLEGFTKPTEWPGLIDQESPIKSFIDPYLPEQWESPKKISVMLERMISRHNNSIVVLSYLSGGVPGVEEIRAIFKKNFSRYKVCKLPFNYALSRKSVNELLFVGYPK